MTDEVDKTNKQTHRFIYLVILVCTYLPQSSLFLFSHIFFSIAFQFVFIYPSQSFITVHNVFSLFMSISNIFVLKYCRTILWSSDDCRSHLVWPIIVYRHVKPNCTQVTLCLRYVACPFYYWCRWLPRFDYSRYRTRLPARSRSCVYVSRNFKALCPNIA